MGVPVGTLIAGAGIFSLALGLGAQGFVSDIVTGAFILMEDQINVGDSVKIGTVEGTVSAVGIRTTRSHQCGRYFGFIPNRNITIVSNKSVMRCEPWCRSPFFLTRPLTRSTTSLASEPNHFSNTVSTITQAQI